MADDESKDRQAIWGIRKKHEIWFYTFLLIFGGGNIARLDWEDWDSFVLAAGERILASVLIVWFICQAFDWGLSGLMSAGDYFRQQIARRKKAEEQARKELEEQARKKAEEKARQEEQERREQFAKEVVKLLQKNHAPQEDIQQVQYISDSLKPPTPQTSGGGR